MATMCGREQTPNQKRVLIFCVEITLATYRLCASIRSKYSLYPHIASYSVYLHCIVLLQAYNQWIQKELGEAMQQAKMATGIERKFVVIMTTR